MEPQESQPPQKPTKAYGKRALWQWILLYIVIAVIVYGLIYIIFIHKGGSTSTNGY
jgi:flagellar basal body-associated protein FliL